MRAKQVRPLLRTVQMERVYPHPPERVWQALTDPQALAQWLLPTTFQPKVGHRFRFVRRSSGGKSQKVRCQVVELDAPHRLAYTWQAEGEEVPTLVTWTLESVEEGSRLRLEHIGLPPTNANNGEIVSLAGDRLSELPPDAFGTATQRNHAHVSGSSSHARPVGRIVLETPSRSLRCVSRAHTSTQFTVTTSQEAVSCKLPSAPVLLRRK